MQNQASKRLLIAILIISALNLLTSIIQISISISTLVPTEKETTTGDATLTHNWTETELDKIATRVTEPYNRKDLEKLYSILDELTKQQLTLAEFTSQLSNSYDFIGTVESSTYLGSTEMKVPGQLNTYKLNYSIRLSGGKFETGRMTITVIDRDGTPGIVGIFLNGNT